MYQGKHTFVVYIYFMDNYLQKLLTNLQIDKINKLQESAYTQIREKQNTIVVSPTGSGKTLAFLLPIASLLTVSSDSVQCIVIVPSRELALQIESVWRKMNTGFKVAVCYGGHDIDVEKNNLKNNPALIVATPGRLLDHIERESFDNTTVKFLVLDEFDKSLELGFHDQMGAIIAAFPQLEKRILTSATSAMELPSFINAYDFATLDMSAKNGESDALSSYIVISEDRDKADKLFQLLCSLNSESAIIFCNHRESAERVSKLMNEKGIQIGYYHGGLEQADRERILIQFRNGSLRYLVTTDLAARGLDIPEIRHVIHYHLPSKENEFIHRNGRTARMGATGSVYLLLFVEESIPDYITDGLDVLKLGATTTLPKEPDFDTIYISGGRKNKLSKADIVGFFLQKGELSKDDLGLIEVKDFASFVAIRKEKTKSLLTKLANQKMKGKKYKIEVARSI